jgi:23S rRNA pseudouridine2605 synthase
LPKNKTRPEPILVSERLQKALAGAGLGSRRAMETAIKEGKVRVNGKVAEIGSSVATGDKISIAGKTFEAKNTRISARTLVYNKPEGEITTRNDPQGRKTIFENLPKLHNARWIAIGRLDINTTGLLLLTTDGELAHMMMHPSSGVDREYACRIHGRATDEQLNKLKKGVKLEDGLARFSDIQPAGHSGENSWYHVVITEGRNREVRRLWASQGLQVSRLKRVRYGAAFLPKRMRTGEFEELSPRDHQVLREDAGLPATANQLILRESKRRR